MSLTRKNWDLMKANYVYFENCPIFTVEFYPKLKVKTKAFEV